MISIVTDSCSYFKEAESIRLGIKMIPIRYIVNDRAYLESYSDQNGDFENLLKCGSRLSTLQPNAEAFLRCFEEEIAQGNKVLCITMSSRLSGTYSAAYVAAKQTGNQDVIVFDSCLIAGGLYLLVKKAKELIQNGLTLAEIVKALEEIRSKITVVFSVGNINPLRKSGRIGFVRMSVETILNRKPILFLKEGVVSFGSMARGSSDITEKLLHSINSHATEAVINYIGNGRLATNLYSIIETDYPGLSVSLHKVGPVLGIHLGLNMVAVSFVA